MVNIILIMVIVAIIGGASWKVWSDKKKGGKCAGCPYSNGTNGPCSLN